MSLFKVICLRHSLINLKQNLAPEPGLNSSCFCRSWPCWRRTRSCSTRPTLTEMENWTQKNSSHSVTLKKTLKTYLYLPTYLTLESLVPRGGGSKPLGRVQMVWNLYVRVFKFINSYKYGDLLTKVFRQQ